MGWSGFSLADDEAYGVLKEAVNKISSVETDMSLYGPIVE